MSPLPDKTNVVLMVVNGELRAKASNIAGNLNVVVVNDAGAFEKAALGLPFNSTRVTDPTLKLVGASFERAGTYTPAS